METFVEGWTTPIDYQLKINGAAFNATGMAVELTLRDKTGAVVVEAGGTAWLDATQSTVRYSPDAADLTFARSPIRAHWKVTDVGGKIAYFPRGEGEEWVIYLP